MVVVGPYQGEEIFQAGNCRLQTVGEIEERTDLTSGVLDLPPFGPDGTTADSFFDIYFQIDVAGRTFSR